MGNKVMLFNIITFGLLDDDDDSDDDTNEGDEEATTSDVDGVIDSLMGRRK
jgi:hypothetical protein